MGKRFGPLHAVPAGLVVGDPTRRHLRLAAEGIHHADGTTSLALIPWEQLVHLDLGLETTRFRWPGLMSGVAWALAAALMQDDPGVEVRDGVATAVTHGGVRELALSRHHTGKYWRGAVERIDLLLRRMIDSPEHRALLSRPDAVVRMVARSARGRTR